VSTFFTVGDPARPEAAFPAAQPVEFKGPGPDGTRLALLLPEDLSQRLSVAREHAGPPGQASSLLGPDRLPGGSCLDQLLGGTMKNSSALLATAAVVAAAGIMATLPASPLLAQVRAAVVRDVDQPARQSVTIRKFTNTNFFETVYVVPAGKKFVLEHMNCSSRADQLFAAIFEGTLTHANIVYSVPVINVSGTILVADGATSIYFEPGAALNLRIFVTEATTCTLSGHTVDLVA
jgi:hypothetical protein